MRYPKLFPYLVEKGIQINAVCTEGVSFRGGVLRKFLSGLIPHKVRLDGVNYYYVPSFLVPSPALKAWLSAPMIFLASVILARGTDVVYAEDTRLHGLCASLVRKALRCGFAANYGDIFWYRPSKWLRDPRSNGVFSLAYLMERMVLTDPNLGYLVVGSPLIGDYVAGRYPHVKSIFMPNGYSSDQSGLGEDTQKLKLELGLDGKKTVLYAGSIHKHYRPDVLVRAAMSVVKEVPDVMFVIIGDGFLHDYMVESVQSAGLQGSFLFLGHRPHDFVVKAIRMSDLCVNLSDGYPSIGMKGADYMSQAKAYVLATRYRVGSFFQRSGYNCTMTSLDPGEFAGAIVELLLDREKAEELGRNAYDSIKDYTWSKMADTEARLLTELSVSSSRTASG